MAMSPVPSTFSTQHWNVPHILTCEIIQEQYLVVSRQPRNLPRPLGRCRWLFQSPPKQRQDDWTPSSAKLAAALSHFGTATMHQTIPLLVLPPQDGDWKFILYTFHKLESLTTFFSLPTPSSEKPTLKPLIPSNDTHHQGKRWIKD